MAEVVADAVQRRAWYQLLVDPVDGDPLVFGAQFLNGTAQLVVRLVHVVINDHLVKVLLVLALDARALVKCAAEIVLLQPQE